MAKGNRILFLDIDGVLLPGRAYMLPNQTKPIVKTLDPCAVSMLNAACKKQGRKIVVHSSWIRTGFWKIGDDGPGDVIDHLVAEGVEREHFHEDWCCRRETHWRYDRIDEWLSRHPEVDDFVILDDSPCDEGYCNRKHLILCDFDEGITMEIFRKINDGVFPR